MLEEKINRLKNINIVFWLLLAGVTLGAFYLPLNGLNTLQLEQRHPGPLVGPSLLWYLYYLTLAGLGLFTWFQARSTPHQELTRFKARHALGWTVAGSYLLYSLAIVLWHFEFLGWSIFLLILTALVLFAVNSNIRDEPEVMIEKFWVRNPFSFFLGWVLYLLMMTIAMRHGSTFSQEFPALVLFLVFLGIVIFYGLRRLNAGVPIIWIGALAILLLQNTAPRTLRSFLWIGLALLVITLVFILRRSLSLRTRHKPVSRAMDKFNFGAASQLEVLEAELNDQLRTKPGARISLK